MLGGIGRAIVVGCWGELAVLGAVWELNIGEGGVREGKDSC